MGKDGTRIVKDSMGEMTIAEDALFGAQTQRAVNNFPISGLTMPRDFIRALGLIKQSAAKANADLGFCSIKVLLKPLKMALSNYFRRSR